MNEKYESLKLSARSNSVKRNKIEELVKGLNDLYPDKYEDVKSALMIDFLTLKRDSDKIGKEMDIIRNNCEHNYVSDGYDSHKDYFICTKCGNTYSV